MLAWLAPLLVFGLVIFVHELGHFIAAKVFGIYAPRFSVGFGPALWRRRFGETEYVLAALPLGGYVRMASREDEAAALLEGGGETGEVERGDDWDPNAMIPFGPVPIPEDRWIESKPLSARVVVLLSGVTMNALLAFAVTVILLAAYGEPYLSTRADSVLPGRPAAAAGLQRGDSIVAINGAPVRDWGVLVDRVGSSAGVPLTLDVLRGTQRLALTVTPAAEDGAAPGAAAPSKRVGRIGLVPVQARMSVAPGSAVVQAVPVTIRLGGTVFSALGSIATRRTGVGELGGPLAIAQASVQAARAGAENLLFLIALISINLAVLNLLPIPILDGGQLLIVLLEAAKGSAFSERSRGYILRAGLAAIGLLFAVVMFNDLKRIALSLTGQAG